MIRSLPLTLGALLLSFTLTRANPPAADDDNSLKNVLAVQQTMEQARYLLLVPNAKKAVEILEENLPRINGNANYLRLLREAYRGYIKDLWQTKQPVLAKRYLGRLSILDPHAAQDPILCGNLQQDEKTGGQAYTRNFEKPAPVTASPAATAAPVAGGPEPRPYQAPTVRGKLDDPFAASNQRLRGDAGLLAQVGNNGQAAVAGVKIQHLGKNVQGWEVTETAHFRIFHKQSEDYVEKVARLVEQTRLDMYRKWFGHDGPEWIARCDLFLHPTVNDYSRVTGESTESPGHSRIEIDPANQRVVGRRMDMHCDQQGMLETVLPHETTHTVLAGMFGAVQVPRWADEGMAVLTETQGRVEQHRRNLIRCYKENALFGVHELMQLGDYPPRQRISAFYAQSVFLVEFLTAQRGPVVFTEFMRDGLREGYELALRRHYAWGFSDLEQFWGQYLANETNRVASR